MQNVKVQEATLIRPRAYYYFARLIEQFVKGAGDAAVALYNLPHKIVA